MTALTADRNTAVREGRTFVRPVAANAKIFAGALVVLSGGYAEPGQTALNLIADGRAEHHVDNSGGGAGALTITVHSGCYPFVSAAGADAIAISDIGSPCYIVDDQTVAKTDGGGTRSRAGTILDIDTAGVWVGVGLLHP